MAGSGVRKVLVAALVAFAAAGVADATAAIRHVAPTGTGTECTVAAPCGLEVGIEGAASGDEVAIGAGSYTAAAGPGESIDFPLGPATVTARGATVGTGRPVITTRLVRVRGTSVLSDVELRSSGAFVSSVLSVTGGRAERVLAENTSASGPACDIVNPGSVLVDSVCRVTVPGNAFAALEVYGGVTVRNVTAYAAGAAAVRTEGAFSTSDVINSVADGSGPDVDRFNGGGTVTLTNSYFAAFTDGFMPPFVITGRVSTGLALRAAPGDLRQTAGSTTVDAGTATGVAAGELDLNGNLRTVGAAPDIGAYEQVPPPAIATGTAAVATSAATVRPVVTTGGGRTQVTLAYGTTPGAPTGQVTVTAPAAAAPGVVELPLTGLSAGTTYYYVVTATSDGGTTQSAPSSFTTAAVPVPPAPPTPPAPPADVTRPRVTVSLPAALAIGRRTSLVARVVCNEPCALTVRARLGVRGGKPARFRLLPNARITLRLRPVRTTRLADVDDVRLTLSGARRAALTALGAGRRVVVRIEIQAKDASGNVRRVTRFVAVRR